MTHWKKLTNPNYLGVYALEDGKDVVLTISKVIREMVTGADGKKEECTVIYFTEDIKPMIANSTNLKQIAKLYGNYIEAWTNKKIQIGSERVKAFGEIVDALRVRKNVPSVEAPREIKCEACGSAIGAFGKMNADQMAKYTKEKYGISLCSKCATDRAAKEKTEAEKSEGDAE